ncbi:MAG: HVO_A0114 family putative DNA-binding protein [Candidatus Heimdallarchaeaceae archaeon]
MSFALTSLISKDITCFDVIKILFALSDKEMEILACINHLQPVSIKEITEIIPKDRATISRSINRLMGIGIVRKEKVNLKQGGYQYLYKSLPMDELKGKVKQTLDQVIKNMQSAMNNLSEEKCEEIFEEVKQKYNNHHKTSET